MSVVLVLECLWLFADLRRLLGGATAAFRAATASLGIHYILIPTCIFELFARKCREVSFTTVTIVGIQHGILLFKRSNLFKGRNSFFNSPVSFLLQWSVLYIYCSASNTIHHQSLNHILSISLYYNHNSNSIAQIHIYNLSSKLYHLFLLPPSKLHPLGINSVVQIPFLQYAM